MNYDKSNEGQQRSTHDDKHGYDKKPMPSHDKSKHDQEKNPSHQDRKPQDQSERR